MERTKGRLSRVGASSPGPVSSTLYRKRGCRLSAQAKRAPPSPTSPPDPASGPRVGGDGTEYAAGFRGGDKFMQDCCSRHPPACGEGSRVGLVGPDIGALNTPSFLPHRGEGFSPLTWHDGGLVRSGNSSLDGLRPVPQRKSLQCSDWRRGGREGVAPPTLNCSRVRRLTPVARQSPAPLSPPPRCPWPAPTLRLRPTDAPR